MSDKKSDYHLIEDQDYERGHVPESKELSFNTKLRLGFIRKVYGILSVQLLFTLVLSTLSMVSHTFYTFQRDNFWLMAIAMIGVICLPCATLCFDNLLRRHPDNYIFLGVFTFCEAYLVGFICGSTNPRLVLMAVCMTFSIVLALTLYACTTKSDFTMSGAMLFILCSALLMFSIFAIFTTNKIIHILLSTLWIILLGFYLIYDTQLILGNHERKISEDDYILASFMLYVDIITMFIEILRLLGLLSNDQ